MMNIATTPRIVKRHCGGYLALSEEGSRFRIGVEGDTEEEARKRFQESLKMWERTTENAEEDTYDA